MNKKLKIFYIIDILILIVSFIAVIIIDNSNTYGLAALTSVGHLVVCGIIFLISLILLIVVFLVHMIIKFHKKKL